MADTLTGKTRYRSDCVGFINRKDVLVLQVQTKWSDGPNDHNGMPTYLAGEGWRDAGVEDLAALEELRSKEQGS